MDFSSTLERCNANDISVDRIHGLTIKFRDRVRCVLQLVSDSCIMNITRSRWVCYLTEFAEEYDFSFGKEAVGSKFRLTVSTASSFWRNRRLRDEVIPAFFWFIPVRLASILQDQIRAEKEKFRRRRGHWKKRNKGIAVVARKRVEGMFARILSAIAKGLF